MDSSTTDLRRLRLFRALAEEHPQNTFEFRLLANGKNVLN